MVCCDGELSIGKWFHCLRLKKAPRTKSSIVQTSQGSNQKFTFHFKIKFCV